MKTPNKLLVPTDFSDMSAPELGYAGMLGKAFDAQILLVHVVKRPVFLPTTAGAPAAVPASEEEIHEWVLKHLARLQQRASDEVAVATRRVEGDPAKEIVRVAEEEDADLILMSTHGRKGLARALLGSTAEQVMRDAPCPVLCIKQGSHEFALQ